MILAPGSTIGIVGGGQLGRMLAMAAARLGYRCHIYAPDEAPPAAEVAAGFTRGAWHDEARPGLAEALLQALADRTGEEIAGDMRGAVDHDPRLATGLRAMQRAMECVEGVPARIEVGFENGSGLGRRLRTDRDRWRDGGCCERRRMRGAWRTRRPWPLRQTALTARQLAATGER